MKLFSAVVLLVGSTVLPGVRADAQQVWSSTHAQHVAGLADVKAKDKGVLELSATTLRFAGKSGRSSIPRESIVAVSAGNQRVEIWGISGRILRGVIPDGGGIAAAAFMHHRVDMLTVEFEDARGGYHGAVFFLPAKEATSALESFAKSPIVARDTQDNVCHDGFVLPGSVLLATPHWEEAQVPAVYRALVYERLEERLKKLPTVYHLYRDGESYTGQGCPEYTVQLSANAFREGSQVKRAMLGPLGFFVGTTQLRFDATVTDFAGQKRLAEEFKGTVRGESESTTVADDIAKKLAKKYAGMLRSADANGAVPKMAEPKNANGLVQR